ncbi:MAG: IS1634 family transposase, partial [Austwickia sp.]|nr:IS1634 family transposase [Austwickia sp.]
MGPACAHRYRVGATAVQIAESTRGRRRIVRHVGSARTDAELGILLEQAQQLLDEDQQGILDLRLTPGIRQTSLLAVPAELTLFATTSGPPARQIVHRARVLKATSQVLYYALAQVYASLGFDVLDDPVFRDLVIARLVEPTSLLDVDRVLAGVGRKAPSPSTRKRTLSRGVYGRLPRQD